MRSNNLRRRTVTRKPPTRRPATRRHPLPARTRPNAMRRLPRRRRRPPRWRRFLWSLVTAVACLGCVTAGALWLLRARALTTLGSLTPPFGGREQVNLLVLGVDDGRGGLGRSDTMLLLHVDTR